MRLPSRMYSDDPSSLQRRSRQMGLVIGTSAYVSPAQARGPSRHDHQDDIWAFGGVLQLTDAFHAVIGPSRPKYIPAQGRRRDEFSEREHWQHLIEAGGSLEPFAGICSVACATPPTLSVTPATIGHVRLALEGTFRDSRVAGGWIRRHMSQPARWRPTRALGSQRASRY